MSTEPENGWVGVLAIVAATVGWDVHALRTGQQTISEWIGNLVARHPVMGWTPLLYLLAHLTRHPRWLHRYDPLRLVATEIAARRQA